MSDQSSEDQEKIDEYLSIIQERIVAPIQVTGLQGYCAATLLLLFAAIDGLGKLLDPDSAAGSNQRIRGFLTYMDGDYAARTKELLDLRHSLVHNAINVESFLSHTEIGGDQHLKKLGAAGFLYVNTVTMHKDFMDAFRRFRAEIQRDPVLMKRAADRLEWTEDNPFHDPNIPTPSSPSPVKFIHATGSPKRH